jgi:hypothetical protein
MADVSSQFVAAIPGGQLIGGMVNNSQAVKQCIQLENPSNSISFSTIQKLLNPGGVQSAIQEQCAQQFGAQKQQCDQMKLSMCALMPKPPQT